MSPRDQKSDEHEDHPQKVENCHGHQQKLSNADIIPDAGKIYLGTFQSCF
jgi:hypothetical protein